MNDFKTKQEEFWAGSFGNEYIERNDSKFTIAANIALFSQIFKKASLDINSVIEFGANIGLNLKAIKQLLPNIQLSGIEINQEASEQLELLGNVNIHQQSILDFEVTSKVDLALIKGVLIHINPDELQDVYKKLYDVSCKYILIIEYYNPTPVGISYRGHADKLFKRDFAGEMLDKYQDLLLVDYGFSYHRDKHFPLDDVTWFLLEKR